MTSASSTWTLLIAALGGEGGGVLADWLVECALDAGLPVQATSVPGVAQRTGATSYYIEMLRAPLSTDAAAPVFALTPVPGCVDVVVASELLEAARMLERGFVTQRTTLIASTHRVYTTLEKMHMDDGRQDAGRMQAAARTLAGRAVLLDMEAATAKSGTVISAVMFGALAGAGVLPWTRDACERAIRASGKGVDASLAGFALAFEAAATQGPGGAGPAVEPAARVAQAASQLLLDAAHRDPRVRAVEPGWRERMAPWPDAVQIIAVYGALRCLDYQDAAYATRYLDALAQLAGAARAADASDAMTPALEEAARQMALWMCFEDVIRVADLKTRRSRFERVRAEAQAAPSEIVRITEHFKPGVDEVASVLPVRLGRWLLARAQRKGTQASSHRGLHIRSTSLWGYLMLRFLARLRPLRPRSLRFAQEHEALDAWRGAMQQLLGLGAAPAAKLALALAGLPQVLKGYGDTQARGRQSYARLWAAHVVPALAGERDVATSAHALQTALAQALADPEGRLNGGAVAQPASAVQRGEPRGVAQPQPVFWARSPTTPASGKTP